MNGFKDGFEQYVNAVWEQETIGELPDDSYHEGKIRLAHQPGRKFHSTDRIWGCGQGRHQEDWGWHSLSDVDPSQRCKRCSNHLKKLSQSIRTTTERARDVLMRLRKVFELWDVPFKEGNKLSHFPLQLPPVPDLPLSKRIALLQKVEDVAREHAGSKATFNLSQQLLDQMVTRMRHSPAMLAALFTFQRRAHAWERTASWYPREVSCNPAIGRQLALGATFQELRRIGEKLVPTDSWDYLQTFDPEVSWDEPLVLWTVENYGQHHRYSQNGGNFIAYHYFGKKYGGSVPPGFFLAPSNLQPLHGLDPVTSRADVNVLMQLPYTLRDLPHVIAVIEQAAHLLENGSVAEPRRAVDAVLTALA